MGTSDGIYLAYPILVPRLLPTSRDWPRGPSLRAPFSYKVVSLIVLGSARAVRHTIGLLEALWGQVRFHERDLRCISIAVTHGTRCVPLEVQEVILTDMLPPQLFI